MMRHVYQGSPTYYIDSSYNAFSLERQRHEIVASARLEDSSSSSSSGSDSPGDSERVRDRRVSDRQVNDREEVPPTRRIDSRESQLVQAAAKGQIENVRSLLDAKVNPNSSGAYCTPPWLWQLQINMFIL